MRGPLEGGDDEHNPDGYVSLKARLDVDMLNAQQARSGNSYFCNRRRISNRTFGVHIREFVFTVDAGVDQIQSLSGGQGGPTLALTGRGGDDSAAGEGIVTSCLNGIEGLFELCGLDNDQDQGLLELYILSQIRVLGQARQEMMFDEEGETSGSAFAVQFGGIVTRVTGRHISIGEYVRYAIPRKEEFNNPSWVMDEGVEPSKIGLVLQPVRAYDGMNFGMYCYKLAHCLDATTERASFSNGGSLGLATLGRGCENFALTCGLAMVHRLLQFGFLQAESPLFTVPGANGQTWDLNQVLNSGAANAAALDVPMANAFATQLKDIATLPSATRHSHSNANDHMETGLDGGQYERSFHPGSKTNRVRGSTMFYSTKNDANPCFETWAESKPAEPAHLADDAAKQNRAWDLITGGITAHTTPEQIVTILAHAFGVVNINTQTKDTIAGFNVKKPITNMTAAQKLHSKECKKAFMDSIFIHENTVGMARLPDGIEPKELEIGYTKTDDKRLVKRKIQGDARKLLSWVNPRNGIDYTNCAIENALPNLWQALAFSVSMGRSVIAGKATRVGGPHQAADIMMVN